MPVTAATIFLSAFLLFLVQPIIAKQILPWFGGSAAVWTTCLLFFQVILLIGYAYAHALSRLASPRRQALLHSVLLAASLVFLPIIPGDLWRPSPSADPTFKILLLLAATIGLPYFLLSSSGPLLQAWLSREQKTLAQRNSIYRLFALSNIGSLCGLLAYPIGIEPLIGTHGQARVWSAGYVLYCAGCAICAWRSARHGAAAEATALSAEDARPPTLLRYLRWLGCAALGSALLLSVSNHLSQNIASIPFLWVLPLSVYLFSFVICFEGREGRGWYSRRWLLVPTMVMTAAMAWALITQNAVLDIYIAVPLFATGLLFGCCVCHGELAATKPAPTFLTQFYLSIAAGGALGAFLVAIVAPHLFNYYWETPLALLALALLMLAANLGHAPPPGWFRWSLACLGGVGAAALILAAGDQLPGFDMEAFSKRWLHVDRMWHIGAGGAAVLAVLVLVRLRMSLVIAVACVLCTAAYGWDFYSFIVEDTEYLVRDFYGTLRIKPVGSGADRSRRLMHGVILHGEQFVDPARARLATTYYGPTSGIGRTLNVLHNERGALSVGSIGLGTGTLAAYGEKGDRWRIYEIDPAVLEVASHRFRFLSDSAADIKVVLGDARLSLEAERNQGRFAVPAQRFDVLSVDAFSSDAIPIHLITREALQLFAQAIKPDGIIAFHVSNRYLDLAPVVAQIASAQGFEALEFDDTPDDRLTYAITDWVLVTRNRAFLDDPEIAPFGHPVTARAHLRLWTDQFNNLFQILQ